MRVRHPTGILPDYWRHDDIAALQLRYVEDANAGPFLRFRAAHKKVVIVADPAAVQEILSRWVPVWAGPTRPTPASCMTHDSGRMRHCQR
jgi:hypothetical protein